MTGWVAAPIPACDPLQQAQKERGDLEILTLIPSFGGLLYTIAAFVVALSVIVAIHEYGHYIVGRWCGIHA